MSRRVQLIRESAAEASLLSEGRARGHVRDECGALVVRARGGELTAFDELYRLHRDKMYTLCLNLCGDREQAQDLLQETFVRAWRGLRGFQGRSSFATWLHRIAVNVCRDAARRRREAPRREPEVAADRETVEQVRAALMQLKAPHRVVLALRYTLSLSYQEIAETLGWSMSRVKVTIHRAKSDFRNAYRDVDGD